MDTYAHGYSNTGHYARPGTHTSYCGREIQQAPNTSIAVRVCKTCAKAEAADRAAADQATAEAEAQQAAELVTEAEADDGTRRGEWTGGQGDSFTREALGEPVSPDLAALARIKAKPEADPAVYPAGMDARQAAERARYGGQQTAAEPHVIEGVIVEHDGTAEGSTPANAAHPNVCAAREALAGLKPAQLTDHHDPADPTEAERGVRGYMVDPREGNRVAIYWLEGGRTIRRDDSWHGPALDCLADRLRRRGWLVEKMLKSSQCVFAHRPQ
ncbi:hypothetical protein ACF1DY_31625 [Streptomyces albus]